MASKDKDKEFHVISESKQTILFIPQDEGQELATDIIVFISKRASTFVKKDEKNFLWEWFQQNTWKPVIDTLQVPLENFYQNCVNLKMVP